MEAGRIRAPAPVELRGTRRLPDRIGDRALLLLTGGAAALSLLIIALIAAPCAIANVTAGRVLVQRQDIAMLKALGFTPGQVVRMLLAEQTLLGAVGAGLGLIAARVMTLPQFVRPPDGTPVGLAPLSGTWMALIGVGTVLTVAIATVVPAWWAGRVSPVAAVQPSPPRGHLSLIARLSLLFHLPAALVLGARDSLTRRLSAGLTVLGLAIPMAMITIALTCWSTIDGFSSNPGKIGLAAAIMVSQGGLDASQTAALIARDDQGTSSQILQLLRTMHPELDPYRLTFATSTPVDMNHMANARRVRLVGYSIVGLAAAALGLVLLRRRFAT